MYRTSLDYKILDDPIFVCGWTRTDDVAGARCRYSIEKREEEARTGKRRQERLRTMSMRCPRSEKPAGLTSNDSPQNRMSRYTTFR